MKKYKIDITGLWYNDFKFIDTPDGKQPLLDKIKKYDKRCYAILFDNGDIIECSEDHRIQLSSEEWIYAKHLNIGDIIISLDGTTSVLKIQDIGIHDVYDLEVGHENHRYWSESVSSHNTGKSATCNAILKELNGEALWINASLENGIDVLRGKIQKFASTGSFDDSIKVVVMDEFDNMSQSAMAAFRGFLDEFGNNCVFLFTCNYKEKIIEPLLTRLQVFDFNNFKKEEMIKPIFERLKFILENETIQYDAKDLIPVINTFYPSIRNMIGTLQKCSNNGVLKIEDLDDANIYDTVMKVLTPSTYLDMISEVNKLNAPDNMYSYIYKNAGKYFPPNNYPKVIVTIAKYQHMSGTVRDKNLNLSAALTELVSLRS